METVQTQSEKIRAKAEDMLARAREMEVVAKIFPEAMLKPMFDNGIGEMVYQVPSVLLGPKGTNLEGLPKLILHPNGGGIYMAWTRKITRGPVSIMVYSRPEKLGSYQISELLQKLTSKQLLEVLSPKNS